jgi:hypothetical protein
VCEHGGGLRVEDEGFVAYIPTCECLRVGQGVIQGKDHAEGFGGDAFSTHPGDGVWIPDKGSIDLPLGKNSHEL